VPELGNAVQDEGRQPAQPGTDHPWFPWSPLPARLPPQRWPEGATVAVSIVLDLGAVEWERPDEDFPVLPVGGRGPSPFPDVPRMSHREFGHRVGVFRLLEILTELDIVPAAAVDVLTAEHYPALMEHLAPAAGELLCAGLSASRPLTSRMTEDEERHYIDLSLRRIEAATGEAPAGWLSPEHSESSRTVGLLGEAGLRYVADWADDEQPYPMTGARGDLWSFPLSWELSDVAAMFLRQCDPWVWARSVREAFDRLCADGEDSGRVLALHLHPWLSGQAFRAGAVIDVLTHIRDSGRAWVACPREIVGWCRVSTTRAT
jgi:hypothetical protein